MTGFARAETTVENASVSIEIRSLNSRYLELSVGLPSFLHSLEPAIRSLLGARAHRGKVDVGVRVRLAGGESNYVVDEAAAAAARRALDRIASAAGIRSQPTLGEILSFEGVLRSERDHLPDALREPVLTTLAAALDAWDREREREGRATRDDIDRSVVRIENALAVFASRTADMEALVLEAVRTRFREVLGDEADEQRIYAEAASLMVRHATSEEISRLTTHVAAFRAALDETGPVGKRLDFICQEMNREVNTTGSKTMLADVHAAVIEAKDAVEAIREQIRNIE